MVNKYSELFNTQTIGKIWIKTLLICSFHGIHSDNNLEEKWLQRLVESGTKINHPVGGGDKDGHYWNQYRSFWKE